MKNNNNKSLKEGHGKDTSWATREALERITF